MYEPSAHRHQSRGSRSLLSLVALLLTPVLIAGTVLLASSGASASSHREAPLISQDAFADNTDVYVFIPAGQTENIVLAASWIPFEGPEGGPNYWEWGKNVTYNIYVDVDGDAVEEVTYSLTGRVEVANPDTFLYNTAPIESPSSSAWNRRQYITVVESFEPGSEPSGSSATHILVDDELTSPVNIGSKSTPEYQALADAAIYTYTDGGNGDEVKVFGGQTDDAFFVDLQVFDLLTLRGQRPPVGYFGRDNRPVDSVSGYNVHSLVLEIPISRLVRNSEPVLGVWATAQRPSMLTFEGDEREANGSLTQVSRLGMPLVNEVVLPMGLKDVFNSIPPSVDLTVYALLQESVEDPEVGNLLCGLYGVPLPGDSDDDCQTEYTPGTPRTGRGDIFDIFLTGMVLANKFTINTMDGPVELPAGFNVNRPAGVVPADMIRINTAISGSLCSPRPHRLGVLGGDACGFPNGRRFTDDAVDIELLAVAGAAYEALDDRDASFSFDSSLLRVLTDRVDANDIPFRTEFPYMALAQSGQSHFHQNQRGPRAAPEVVGAAMLLAPTGDAGEGGLSALTGSTAWFTGVASNPTPRNISLMVLASALFTAVAAVAIARRRRAEALAVS